MTELELRVAKVSTQVAAVRAAGPGASALPRATTAVLSDTSAALKRILHAGGAGTAPTDPARAPRLILQPDIIAALASSIAVVMGVLNPEHVDDDDLV